jgi:hypothetical protein
MVKWLKDFHGARRSIGALILLFTLLCSSAAYSDGDEQWQVWQSESIEIPLSKRLKAILSSESRYEYGSLYYLDEEIDLVHSASSKTDLEAGYRHVTKSSSSGWQTENDYYGGLILKGRLGSLQLSDRNRLEYRAFSYESPNYVRYRNKLALSMQGKISPYIADEIFYEIGGEHPGINGNRLYLGVKGDLGKSVNLDIYIMRQMEAKYMEEGKTRERFNAVGGALTVRF